MEHINLNFDHHYFLIQCIVRVFIIFFFFKSGLFIYLFEARECVGWVPPASPSREREADTLLSVDPLHTGLCPTTLRLCLNRNQESDTTLTETSRCP